MQALPLGKIPVAVATGLLNFCWLPCTFATSCDEDVSDMLQRPKKQPWSDNSEVLRRTEKYKMKEGIYESPKVFVGIPSSHSERREVWRKNWRCGEKLRELGIPYKFIVGWPVDPARNLTAEMQGLKAFKSEVSKTNLLRNESETYKDLHFVHLPDTYLTLQAKTFALLDYAYSLGVSYVMKMDDDACVNGTRLLEALTTHEVNTLKGGPTALYAGYYRWEGTEFKYMRGMDNRTHPYFSGPAYIISKDLIEKIIEDDEMNSVLWANYGSFDEDAQTGRWVAFAEEEHHLKVEWMPVTKLLSHEKNKLSKFDEFLLKRAASRRARLR